jgi:hypothetical protein
MFILCRDLISKEIVIIFLVCICQDYYRYSEFEYCALVTVGNR